MTLKNIFVSLGSLLVGTVFLLSAWFKLFPIEPFEYKIVGSTFFGWLPSVFVARLVIAAELGIGLLLVFSYRLKVSLKLAVGALVIFSLHLLYVLIRQGNLSDCGCMGTLIAFTPLQGLVKNLVLIGLCLILSRHAFQFELKFPHMYYAVFLVAVTYVFIVNPVDLSYSEKYLSKPFERFSLNLDTLYLAEDREKVEMPAKDIRNEKIILAFVSASCPHCRIAAEKIAVIRQKNPGIPFYFFINGDDDKIIEFIKKTGISDIPHSRLNGQLFVVMAGLKLPVIYYFNKGFVERQVDYYTLEQSHIEAWLKQP